MASPAFQPLADPASSLGALSRGAPSRGAQVEALLRERKLDRTLTTALPASSEVDQLAAFCVPSLDQRLRGGVPRGQMSELIGPVSSGRTSLAWAWLSAATRRGEAVALIDTFDRFDAVSGAACGIELSRLLWVRGQAITKTTAAVDPAWLPGARAVDGPGTLLERTIDRALKALNLVLQSGVCTAVVLDVADVPLAGLRRVPYTTWLRLQRVIEGTDTACLLIGPTPLARSAGGVTISTGDTGVTGLPAVAPAGAKEGAGGVMGARRPPVPVPPAAPASAVTPRVTGVAGARWIGEHHRSRRLAGLHVETRVSSPRRLVHGTAALDTAALDPTTRHDAWASE